jgi:Mg-chelatase subunit ChlD
MTPSDFRNTDPRTAVASALAMPPKRFVWAEHAGTLFFTALIISVLIHGALMLKFAQESFVHIDPAMLGQEREIIVVQRAPEQDVIVNPLPEEKSDTTQDKQPENMDQPAKEQDLVALSQALLDNNPPPAAASQQVTDDVAMRQVPDEKPADSLDEGKLAEGFPEVALPQSVKASQNVQIPLDVKFTPGTGTGDAGDGEGSGGAGGIALASGDAQNILLGSGLVAGFNPKPQKLAPPVIEERHEMTVDKAVVDAPLTMPKVDFTELAMEEGARVNIPEKLDHDFDYEITRYVTPQDTNTGWFGRKESFTDDGRGYFKVEIIPRKSLKRLPTMPKDVVYLIDISGSVPQTWVDQIVRGVRDSLASLNQQDRFNIVFFSESPMIFSPNQIQPATDENLAKARQFLQDRKSEGMTDVNHALSRLLVRDLEVARVYNLIMISDGRPTRGVLDTRELINLVTRDNDQVASIYCVGVTNRQNRALLEFMAYRNKGFCVYSDNEVEVAQVIRDLCSRLRYPLMKDVRMSLLGIDPEDVYPKDLPNLYQGEKFEVYGRYDRSRKFTMRVVGQNGRRVLDLTFGKDIAEAAVGEKEMPFKWAFWKLHHLYSEMLRRGESERVKAQIEALKKQYNLTTLY